MKQDRRLHQTYYNMIRRCYNPNTSSAKHYYEKGITVCEEWKDYAVFKEWALNNGYNDELTIDRIDPDKNYCPENCRWVSKSENSRRAGYSNKGKKYNKSIQKSEKKDGMYVVCKLSVRSGEITPIKKFSSYLYAIAYRNKLFEENKDFSKTSYILKRNFELE